MGERIQKNPDFVFRQRVPPNGGPPLPRLVEQFITSEADFFLRTHGNIPALDPTTYRLTVCDLHGQSDHFSLERLAESFPQKEITATLQCAGNRRSSAIAVKPVPNEVEWGSEAISNAIWTGFSLADLLRFVGCENPVRHIEFIGADRCHKEGKETFFGASIPLERALAGDAILAWKMNHEPLSPQHGAPLRVVVPGYIGARSVKWLQKINLLNRPSENVFHAHAYRLFPPGASSGSADWDQALELGELSVNSCICSIEEVSDGLSVKGYATAGGARQVVRVDVGYREPQKWAEAVFLDPAGVGVWRRWEVLIPKLLVGELICVRAWDSAANTQPENPENVWNFKGYMNNAWHRVRYGLPSEEVRVEKPQVEYYL
jgi:sulfite oxidase